jgi:iron complex outermembrane receptor protein
MYIELNTRLFTQAMLLAATTALCFGLSTGIAFAQEEVIEEIHVTGSRIQRANQVQPNPVYGLDSEEIKATGQLSMIDVVSDLPQLFASQNSAQSSFFTSTDTSTGLDGSPGLALLDLRSLGPNRTLVLVDGRRHVSGQAGSAGVDVGSIPSSLVDRVEVLTGGASSIYGADAVSGVVNFIMKDNFEGTEIDLQGGVADDSGGGELQLSLTHGQFFMNDRLNVTVNATFRTRDEVKMRDRDWATNSGIASQQNNNWRLAFQNADNMPAGAVLGDSVATTDASGNCVAAFVGTDQSIVDRACGALPQSIERNLRFGLTAPQGLLAIALADDITAAVPERAGSFPLFHQTADLGLLAPGTPVMDFDNNGIDDCLESFVGQFSIGGCSVIDNDTGQPRAFNPGVISGFTDVENFDSIKSDGSPQTGADHQSLDPEIEQFVFNALINFDVTDSTSLFADIKYVESETKYTDGTLSFEDTINISQQNPFVPVPLQTLMNDILALNPQFANTAQYFISRDPEDVHNNGVYERETFRIVAGVEGEFWDTWTWEAAFNYGKTEEDGRDQTLLPDRYYASLDVVLDGAGNPVCRSEVDPNWTLDTFNSGSIFGAPGVNTFTPGDGSCAPGNPFGTGNFSAAAQDFFAPFRTYQDEVTQTVVSLIFTGDTESWFSLPGGSIGLAGGFEYREEESDSVPDDFEQAGYYFNSQTSAVSGDFSVAELFFEFSAPLIEGAKFAKELTIDGAYRYSDYDLAVGETSSYSGGLSWAPVEDVRFRGTFSRAVRAPGIFELFSPQTGTTFNLDIDPCDQSAIDSLALSDPATAALRTANCAADPLVGSGFTNPLTSNFSGRTGGNPDLKEETSDTLTVGVVIAPRFVDGLTITVDYWDIEIKDAIQQIGGEDILRGCYDGPILDPTFCNQFTRIDDPTSGFFGGLNFMETGRINFANLVTSGYDAEIVYGFDLLKGGVVLRANATFLDELTEFRSAFDPSTSDDEKGEMQRPEWAGNFNATWAGERLTLGYQGRYMGNQLHRLVEVNEAGSFDNATTGTNWTHSLSGTYDVTDKLAVNGGIQNLTDEIPFATQPAFPTGLRGRYFFFGVTARL